MGCPHGEGIRVGLRCVNSLGLSADAKSPLTRGSDGSDGRVRLLDVSTGKFIRDLFYTPKPFKFWWYDVVFLPDDRRLGQQMFRKRGAAPTAPGALWDADTGARLDTFQGHTDAIIAAALTPQTGVSGFDRRPG